LLQALPNYPGQLFVIFLTVYWLGVVGEATSGKASKGVATYTSGMGQAQESASSAMSEIGQAKRVGSSSR